MIERLLTMCPGGRRSARAALARFALAAAILGLVPALAPGALAGQEPGNWEFSFSYVTPSMDKSDIVLDNRATGDISGDGTARPGELTQTFSLTNSSFGAARIGYVWTYYFEAEFSYDSNHLRTDYNAEITNLDSGRQVASVSGPVSTQVTTYQVSGLYHPFGNRTWRWQPFVLVGVGWIDVDFTPSAEIRDAMNTSVVANTFSVDFPSGDYGMLVDYGVGVKFFIKPELTVRAEYRAKQYSLLDDRRTDRELAIGFSFFTGGYE